MDFNPRPPHGERLRYTVRLSRGFRISIHAPRMGSDDERSRRRAADQNFNPRPPAWGATLLLGALWEGGCISIHAPRMGSDGHVIDR